MSVTHAGHDRQSDQKSRRKRKTDTKAADPQPAPKMVVGGTGQQVDPSVRRELEERLGHDFGRVRLHTDRDAAALTGLLGADAVTVGQDVFFGEGQYQPGTTAGRRLLAHELLHTVQAPHGLGQLLAGRDEGAVSLPDQPAERAAEEAAEQAVTETPSPGQETDDPAAVADGIKEEQSPGWMRYATVTASRLRSDRLDPATVPARLAAEIARSLRGDPTDASGRVRLQLARLTPDLRASVLTHLRTRLFSSEYDRVRDLAAEAGTRPLGVQAAETPVAVPDAATQAADDHQAQVASRAGDVATREQQGEDAKTEKKDAKARDTARAGKLSQAQQDTATENADTAQRTQAEDTRATEEKQDADKQQQQDDKEASARTEADQQDTERAQKQQDDGDQATQARKEQREREEADPEQATEPGSPKKEQQDAEQRPPAGKQPQPPDVKKAEGPGQVRPEAVDEKADERDSPLARHGLTEKDEDEGEPREEEQPLGAEAGADLDISDAEAGTGRGGKVRGEAEITPDDYLPDTDLDVSSVPTADQIQIGSGGTAQPAVPTFPSPPPTKAEQMEAQRERNADAEEDDTPEADAKAPGEEQGPVAGEAPKPEGGPAAEAVDRTNHDLNPEKPADQEVGPDPQTQDRPEQEQKPEQRKDPQSQQELDADGNQKDKKEEKDTAVERDEAGDGTGTPDAVHPQDEQADRKDADAEQERRDAKGQPDGDAASVPSGVKPSGTAGENDAAADTAASKSTKPSGAQTEPTRAQDRNPSPAAARVSEKVKPDNEAAGPKSSIPKENTATGGDQPAKDDQAGGSEPANAPSSEAGPGAVPTAKKAASVSPASQQTAEGGAKTTGTKEPAQEASLEKNGGGCAPPSPPPEPAEKKCSASGGAKKTAEKEKKPPDVSNQEPKTAVATVSKLRPDQAEQAMPGASKAASNSVDKKRAQLKAQPPTRERPSGAPRTQAKPPPSQPAERQVTGRVEKVGPEPEDKKQQAQGGTRVKGTANVPAPEVPGNRNGQVDSRDVHKMQAAADNIPTTDPELDNKTVGPAPKIRLEGASDPRRTDKQVTKLKDKQTDLQDTGRADASKNLGEDHIYPNAPKEQLKGNVTGGSSAATAPKAGAPAPDGYGTIARQERGAQINAGAAQAQTGIGSAQKKQQQGEQQSKRESQQKIDTEVQRNADQQTKTRGKTADDAKVQRTQWRDAQDAKIKDANTKSGKHHADSNKAIVQHRDDNDKKLEDRKKTDDKKIDSHRKTAESQAKQKKDSSKKDSGGWLHKAISAVGDFFKNLAKAVTDIFNAAIKLINNVIDQFKKWADGVIDSVRNWVVSAINKLADLLIAIGDVLLAAFPALRDKFRKAIEDLRDKAIAAVNKLADALKAAVNKLLDALAATLSGLLKILEAALLEAVKQLQDAITSALKFVNKLVAAYGEFKALIADIAPDPGGWISKAMSAMHIGITQYLWGAIKTAVKAWFDEKVQSVLGLGKQIFNILVKGCLSLKQIAKMAWDAVLAALPMMIISIVIEKVIESLNIAAGTVITIIQGVMAAWQSLSRILHALKAFLDFLKAVKAGPAACMFAEAVAASAVALLDFVSNFLMQRLGKALKPVGARLKSLAQKIMNGLKKVAKGARKVAGRAINSAKGAARKAAQALRKDTHAGKPKTPKVPARAKASADHTRPGGPKRPPGRPEHDRPPSKVPDRQKEHHKDESEAKQATDREKAKETSPPRRPEERAPRERRPDENEPSGKRPEDEDPRARRPDEEEPRAKKPEEEEPGGKKSKEDEPKKKPKETEAPKREKPREPKSRAGRALSKVKNAVKGALKKVGNGLKALGRKLRKSKLGKALERGAKKVRDFFKKKRDNLRDKHNRRKEEKRKKKEEEEKKEGKESKPVRLEKIAARIRPKVSALLVKGIDGRVLDGLLAGMRIWYRLSGLKLSGALRFAIDALLNPQVEVSSGLTMDRNRLLLFVRNLGEELRARDASADESDIDFQARQDEAGLTHTTRGVKGGSASVLAHNIDTAGGPLAKSRQEGETDLINFMDEGSGEKSQVSRIMKNGKNPRNFHVQVTDPFTGKMTAPSYERARKWLNRFPPDQRNKVAVGMTDFLADTSRHAGGIDNSFVKSLASWMVLAEGGRNPSAMVTHAMAIDMVAKGKMNWNTAIRMMPMRKPRLYETVEITDPKTGEKKPKRIPRSDGPGAVKEADSLKTMLTGKRGIRSRNSRRMANSIANRELNIIQAWIRRMDIKVENNASQQEKENQLMEEIRRRMMALYGHSSMPGPESA